MSFQHIQTFVSQIQNESSSLLPEGTNERIDLSEFEAPAIDASTIMTCCKCSTNTTLIVGAPGGTSCDDCGHFECNECDFN